MAPEAQQTGVGGHRAGKRLPQCVMHRMRGATGCPRMTRKGADERTFSLIEVAEHHYVDDAWIVVDGKVYDITEHLINHPGWEPTGDTTTPLSILAHAGMDCTEEFHQIHRPYPKTYKQLPAFRIGHLAEPLPAGQQELAPALS